MVSAAALKPGPIYFSVTAVLPASTNRALRALPDQEGDLNIGAPEPETIDRSVVETEDSSVRGLRESVPDRDDNEEGFHLSKFYTAVSAFLLVCVGVLVVALRTNHGNDKDRPGLDKKSSFHGVILLSMLSICMIGEATADGCTIDCGDYGAPLPEQRKYVTPLFIPGVMDYRERCNENLTMYMNINENYDWGIRNESGAPLTTPIYGYVLQSQ